MIYRRKVGFGVPTGAWLKQPGSLGRFLDVLRDRTFAERGFCDPKGVDKLLADHLNGVADYGHVLWTMVNFELWCRSTIDQVPQAQGRMVS
jgi:asparagine synthase (glutamine-hydrolysing)